MGVISFPTSGLRSVAFDAALVQRLARQGPRYTSYPTADRFHASFGYRDYLQAVAGLRLRASVRPLSVYVHIPFCDTVCYYCACNKVVTRNRDKASTYLSYLKREIAMQGRLLAGINQLSQLHLGGGTPTYLSDTQMDELMATLRANFQFAPDGEGEYGIEVDPRSVTPARIHRLRAQGFNRISLGVQDFDDAVQQAVNRIQPQADTLAIMAAARDAGFRSVSIDLIYGLPRQTMATMAATLAKVVDASPDRIAIYNYAHMPTLFKPQRRIDEAELPAPETKLAMLALCIERLEQAGYVYIGMDHFAKPDDELAIAQRDGHLHRNFQGYSTHAETDMVSCGVSAISAVAGTYSQNHKSLQHYYAALDRGELPVARGVKLSDDDSVRRSVIQRLMCDFTLDVPGFEREHGVVFGDYFEAEMPKLREFEADGLLALNGGAVTVTQKGRLLIRNVAMAFDKYLGKPNHMALQRMQYSRTI